MDNHVAEWSAVYMPTRLLHHTQLSREELSRAWNTIAVMTRRLVYDGCDAIDTCTYRLCVVFAAVEMFKRVALARRLWHPREPIYDIVAASVAVFAATTDGPEECDIEYPSHVVTQGLRHPFARSWFDIPSPVSTTEFTSPFHDCCFVSTLYAAGWYSCGGITKNPFMRWYLDGGNARPADIRHLHNVVLLGVPGSVNGEIRDALCGATSDPMRWAAIRLPSSLARQRDEESAHAEVDGDSGRNPKRNCV